MKPTQTLLTGTLILLVISCSSSKKSSGSGSSGKATYRHLFYAGKQVFLDDNTFRLDSISTDHTYGYTQENPIMVGGGPSNERRFLNALLGPNGEGITYNRTGSCCVFDSPNGMMGGGLLDRYEVKIDGEAEPIFLYINMYDKGVLKAPTGFTFRK